MLLLITYDLKSSDRDYTPLYEAIKNIGDKWWHYMESVWLVHTNLSPTDSFNRLKEYFTQNDTCLIVNITGQERQGWLTSKAWDWIKTNNN